MSFRAVPRLVREQLSRSQALRQSEPSLPYDCCLSVPLLACAIFLLFRVKTPQPVQLLTGIHTENEMTAFPKISLKCRFSTRHHEVSDKKREEVAAPCAIIFAVRNVFHICLSQVSKIFLAIMNLVGFIMSVPLWCLAANTSPPHDNPPS